MRDAPPGHIRDRLRAAIRLPPPRPLRGDRDLWPDRGNGTPPRPERLRRAAVLIPIRWADPQTGFVILTKRAADLPHHGGQVAFPGGSLEPGEDPVTAALREAEEEVGLPPSAVRVEGILEPYHTVTDFLVSPVVGFVEGRIALRPDPREVATVFEVPLLRVLDLRAYRRAHGERDGRRRSFFVLPHEEFFIWGATAHMLHGLAERWQRLDHEAADKTGS